MSHGIENLPGLSGIKSGKRHKYLTMKLRELHEGSMIDKIKAALGTVTGKIVSSVTNLVAAFKKSPNAQLTTIEKFEFVSLNTAILSRVDTGALVCAVDAKDISVDEEKKMVTFKFEDKTFEMPLLRIKDVKNANGTTSRPRVAMDYKWNNNVYHGIETSLIDRSKMKFKGLVGRNLIKQLKLPVHISDNEADD